MFESLTDLIALTVGFGVLWLIWGVLSRADLEGRRERRPLTGVRTSRRAPLSSRSRHGRAA
jgi:hypothetical protein